MNDYECIAKGMEVLTHSEWVRIYRRAIESLSVEDQSKVNYAIDNLKDRCNNIGENGVRELLTKMGLLFDCEDME